MNSTGDITMSLSGNCQSCRGSAGLPFLVAVVSRHLAPRHILPLACFICVLLMSISRALGQDCNANGIPDDCDIDCGMMGGACDVPGCGLSSDCNANAIPDDCEFVPPVLFVNKSALGANDGSSWADAFTDLQTALCVAEGNPAVITQIWVVGGTYTPAGPAGNRGATFQLLNGVGVFGGFAGTETLLSERDPVANVTILSGDLNGDDVPVADPANLLTEPTRAENSFHVVTGSLTDATAILDGFTISGGNANGANPGDSGGGMFNENGSPAVTGCTFTANAAAVLGGGMLNFANSSPTVSNCTFDGNRADVAGGGMDNESSSPIVTGCIFTSNTSAVDGGGLRNTAASPTVTDCTFADNISFNGAGMFNWSGSNPDVTNCTFTTNSAANNGGGMANFNLGNPAVTDCAFSGNSAAYGAGMHNFIDSSPNLTACIFTTNVAAVVGGGMANFAASSPLATNCTFGSNTAADGGGMFNSDNSNPMVTDCTFSSNTADNSGGGMFNALNSSPNITNCMFMGNSAIAFAGGGMNNDNNSNPTVAGCTFDTNMATVNGGGMLNAIDSSPMVSDCTFAGNQASHGAGMFNVGDSNPTVTNCLFTANIASSVDNQGRGGGMNNESSDPIVTGCIFTLNTSEVDGGGLRNAASSPMVTNCTFTGNESGGGAGMFNWAGSNPTVAGCTFDTNMATVNGGGMLNAIDSSPMVSDCTFTANTAVSAGGGMRNNSNSNPTVTGCTFGANSAAFGGGMQNNSSSPTVTNCTFSGNSATNQGGGMRNGDSSPTVTNCTFSGNNAFVGGGMHNVQSSPMVTNCTFSGNTAAGAAGGMLNNASSPAVTDCTFSGNSATNRGGGMRNVNSSSPVVSGCTFGANSAAFGGGMQNNSSSPAVTGCTFSGNSGTSHGGGMGNFNNSSSIVTGCTFTANTAVNNGAGMRNRNSNPTVTGCTFSGNSTNFGGGMNNVENSSPTVTNCAFSGNTAANTGGGMNNFNNSTPTVINCAFSGNTAGNNGGGMRSHLNSIATVTNCTFTANTAVNNGGGIWNNEIGTTVIANSIFWGNTVGGTNMDESAQINSDATSSATVNFSDIQGLTGALGGVGNLGLDPLFVDPDGPDNVPGTADDDLRLMFGSPAIDAADNTAVPPDTADLDGDGDTVEPTPVDPDGNQRFLDDPFTEDTGNPGFGLPIVDMGAFEFVSDCNNNTVVDSDDIATGASNDCNANGIPDECEIDVNSPAPGGPFFCTMNCDPDCNDNGIPDACDIADCPAGDPSCGDCNNNRVPDGCDIASGSSFDVIDNLTGLPSSDGIPDECIRWSSGAPDTLWSNTANWEAGTVPGVGDPAAVESPVIGLSGTLVDLDIDASVDSLVLGMGVTLNINGGNLTLDSPNGLHNDGGLIVADGFSIIAGSPTLLTGSQPIQLAGLTASISSAAVGDTLTSQVTIVGQGIIDADFVNGASGSVIALTGDTVQIAGPMPKVNDGLFEAMDGGTLQIDTAVTGSGLYLADRGTINAFADITEKPPGSGMSVMVVGGTMQVGDGVIGTTIDGCGPIDVLPVIGAANFAGLMEADMSMMLNASGWTIGDQQVGAGLTATMSLINNSTGVVNGPVTVRQNGTLQILNSSLTAVDFVAEDGGAIIVGSAVTLSGSFANGLTDGTPAGWSWAPGSVLTFTGGQTASVQPCTLDGWTTLEVASKDNGSTGVMNEFAFGDIELTAGAHVSLVDLAANNSPAVVEAVYCDNLTLGAGAVLNLNRVNLYVGGVRLSPGPSGGGTITDETRVAGGGLLGDVNGDGVSNIADLTGFVDVLLGIDTDPVHACSADMNTDGTADGGDIQAFVSSLIP